MGALAATIVVRSSLHPFQVRRQCATQHYLEPTLTFWPWDGLHESPLSDVPTGKDPEELVPAIEEVMQYALDAQSTLPDITRRSQRKR